MSDALAAQGGAALSQEAVRVVPAREGTAPWLVITCEHATERVPPGWTWPEEDRWLMGTHWASDLHITPFVEALGLRLAAPAVLSRFSRLLIDPNRPLDSDTLFRNRAEDRPIRWNTGLSKEERERRIRMLYEPYHREADRLVGAHSGAAVLGAHSFTSRYEGQEREVEIGVLYDEDEAIAEAFASSMRGHGYEVRLNEPYSGKQGLIFGPRRHARAHGRVCVELEIRQDRLGDPIHRSRIVELVAAACEQVLKPIAVAQAS